MTSDELTQALQWRYATKAFDPERAIPSSDWEALLKSLVLAPSSFGLQPWKFHVVEDPDTRAQLREHSWGQPQVTDADKLVVFTSRTDMTPEDIRRWIDRLAEVQGQSPEQLEGYATIVEGFCERLSPEARHAWNVRQTYIALGQFMTSAATIGVDTCPLEGIDPSAYDRVLGIDDTGFATCVACAAGYRASSDRSATRPKARFPDAEIIVKD